eukprot:tig00001107_g7098.t1
MLEPFLHATLLGGGGAIRPEALRATLQQAVVLIAQSGGHVESGADAAQVLQRMCQHNNVCGRVWKKDETAYKCRNCEMDPTCAICVDCFDPAMHAGHDYSIIRTGGGCCDCGDPQAWKQEGFCRQHRGASEDSDPLVGVPAAVVANARGAVRVVGRFIGDRLDELPAAPAIANLQEALAWLTGLCSLGDALRRIVCEELCRAGPREAECGVVSRLMQFDRLPNALAPPVHNLYFQLILDVPFKTTFTRLFIANYPRYIHALMASNDDDGGPGGSGDGGSNAVGSGMDNFSVQLFTVPNLTPRCVREGGLLHTLLGTLHSSLERTLIRVPPPPPEPAPGGPPAALISSPPSASLPPPTEGPGGAAAGPAPLRLGAAAAGGAVAGGALGPGEGRVRLPEQVDCSQAGATDKYYWRVTTDLRYVLAHPSVAQHALYARPELFEALVRIYARMHAINGQARAEGAHVEHESDAWQFAFTLEMEALQLVPPLLAGLRAGDTPLPDGAAAPPPDAPGGPEPARLRELLAHVAGQLGSWYEQAGMAERATAAGRVADAAAAGPGDAFTFHLPLVRLHAALASEATRLWPLPLPALLPAEPASLAPCMADQLLRLQLFLAEIRAGRWVRNGRSLLSQLGLYGGVHCFWLDWDLFSLQLCALAMGPERFLWAALARWRLEPFFSFDASRDGAGAEAWQASVGEELLVLLVRILQERSRAGLFHEAAVRRELVHRLAAEDCTHSQVLKHISKRAKECKNLEAIIKEVATYQAPDHVRLQQGRYVLRPECWREVDRFYPHYTRRDLQALDDRTAALPANVAPSHAFEPNDAALFPALRGLPGALSCRATFALVAAALHAAAANSPRATHGSVTAALRLLARLCRAAAGRPPCACSEPGEAPAEGVAGLAEAAAQLPSEWDPAPNLLHPFRIRPASPQEGESARPGPVFRILDALLALRAAPQATALQRADADLIIRLAAERGGPCGDAIRRDAAAAAAAAAAAQPAASASPPARAAAGQEEEEGSGRRRALKERQAKIMEEFRRKQAAFAAAAGPSPSPAPPSVSPSPPPASASASTPASATEAAEAACDGSPLCALCKERGAGPEGRPIAYLSFVQPSRLLALAHPDRSPSADEPRIIVGPPALPGAKPRGVNSPRPSAAVSRPIAAPPQPQQPAGPTISPATAAAAFAAAAAAAAAGGGAAGAGAAAMAATAAATAAAAAGGGRVVAGAAATALAQALVRAGRAAVEAAQEAGAQARRRAEAALAGAAPGVPPAEAQAARDEAAGAAAAEALGQLMETLEGLEEGEEAMPDGDDEEEGEGGEEAEGRRRRQREEMAQAAQAEEELEAMDEDDDGPWADNDDDDELADAEVEEWNLPPAAGAAPSPMVLDEEAAGVASYEAVAGVPFDERPAPGAHASFCGHAMHVECFERYLASLVQRHAAMRTYEGDAIVELERAEILCPTCRRLSNALVPLTPRLAPGPAPAPPAPDGDPLRTALDALAAALRAAAEAPPGRRRRWTALWGSWRSASTARSGACASRRPPRRPCSSPPTSGPPSPTPPPPASSPPGPARRARPLLLLGPAPAACEWGPRDGPAMRALVRRGARRRGAPPRPLLAHDAFQLLCYTLSCLAPARPNAPLQRAALLAAYGTAAHQALLSLHLHGGPGAGSGASEGGEAGAVHEAFARLADSLASVATSPSPAASPALGPRPFDASALGRSPPAGSPLSPVPPLSPDPSALSLSPPGLPALIPSALTLSPPSQPLGPPPAPPLTDFAPGPGPAPARREPPGDLLGRLQVALLPFLRRARLLVALLEGEGEPQAPPPSAEGPAAEFAALLLASRVGPAWLRQASRAAARAPGRPPLAQLLPVRGRGADEPFRLAPLPYLFEELYKRLLAATCPSCAGLPAYHGVCLFCGTVVCVGGRCCRDEAAREGECNSHMRKCGAGVGVFLVLRMSMLLLLRGRRRTFWPAPYLDKYGEEDIEFKRGKPLFLCHSRYAVIERLVAAHALDADPRVLELTIRRDAAWY